MACPRGWLFALGAHLLTGLARPEEVYQVVHHLLESKQVIAADAAPPPPNANIGMTTPAMSGEPVVVT